MYSSNQDNTECAQLYPQIVLYCSYNYVLQWPSQQSPVTRLLGFDLKKIFTMATKMVIQQPRPIAVAPGSDQWTTSICECDNVNECCFSVWCFPCFACITARDHGECLCLPLLDIFGLIPPATLSMRVSTRKRYGITDTICNDCVYTFFCGPCSWCQIRQLSVIQISFLEHGNECKAAPLLLLPSFCDQLLQWWQNLSVSRRRQPLGEYAGHTQGVARPWPQSDSGTVFKKLQKDVMAILKIFHSGALSIISTILDDAALMGKLQDAKFDLLLTDPAFPAGVLLAHYLHLPMVYNVRWLNAGDAHMAIAPSTPSYVPMYNSLFSDRMDFLQRTENFLRYMVSLLQEQFVILPIYDELLKRHFPPGSDLLTMQRSADIWLMRVDFIFEYPRPSVPNVVYIGGFQCRPAEPILPELEEFMQSSGEHGVVVMSLGVMVTALPKQITEAIAAAFAKLPQKVIWRYVGERPSSLGNNTLLLEWLPQNNLLGHPRTCAFVSHGGNNGIYEAIYHGIPVLLLPLLFDQFDNAIRLETRGAARVLEVSTLTSEEFLEALKDVIKNPSYRSNIQKLSELHRDQLIPPLDSATFWIEYVMRHKGAQHLYSEGTRLPWYSYHNLDVQPFRQREQFGPTRIPRWCFCSGGERPQDVAAQRQ
ncbi:hypothetical protein KOW79_006587 [Hemibagrus wyckioides]|uniref:UDP-glycosyltransferase n=1 Tax=Hemibagrus wyckioides TaxID=337641 RepID=A0A9D3SP40_9TELE|nr:hypothetical protein KOW79_006587 [Hemibagrus wyckioides]